MRHPKICLEVILGGGEGRGGRGIIARVNGGGKSLVGFTIIFGMAKILSSHKNLSKFLIVIDVIVLGVIVLGVEVGDEVV